MSRIAIFGLTFLFVQSVYSQSIGEPVNLGLEFGDTLRAAQRDSLGLFPSVKDFKWAVFFLSADSVLSAEVLHENNGGYQSDTIIVGFGTLRGMHLKIIRAGLSFPDSAKVELNDGSLITGEVLGETPTRVIVYSEPLGQLSISRNEVRRIVRRRPGRSGGYYGLVTDPNITSTFLMPTANTPAAGKVFIGDFEVIFLNASVGVTDWLMINGGTLLLPLRARDMVYYYGLKARLFDVPNKFRFAAGLQILQGPILGDASGIVYWVASVGDNDAGLNLAIGDAFSGHGGTGVFGISGDVRVSEGIKVMAELWAADDDTSIPVILGVRFFGSRLSGDIGLLYPINGRIQSPIGIPVASITYSF